LRVKVLGASGSEGAGHLCPAFCIDGKILLDAGTIGVSMDMEEEREIRYILLSHAHFDHIKAIPFLLENLVIRGPHRPVTVMGAGETLDDLRTNILNGRIWPDFARIPDPDAPVVRYAPLRAGVTVRIDAYAVTAVEVRHSVPAYGYILEDAAGTVLAYSGDTGPTERFWEEADRLRAQCLIVEASFPNRMQEVAVRAGHLTPALLRRELSKMIHPPRQIFLTHAKPHYREEIEREIRDLDRDSIRFLAAGEILDV